MVTFFLLFIAWIFPSPVYAQNAPLDDYTFQLNSYIGSYSQWQVFKQDYLANPTLDNQQKALLSAKETIIAREKARASLFRYLGDSIRRQAISQDFVAQTLEDINQMIAYHLGQAQAVQAIKTPRELTDFTSKELIALKRSNKIYISAQVVNKLTLLLRFQQESQRLLSLISPKLPQETLYPVKNGLDQITSYQIQITTQIDQLKTNLEKLSMGEKSAATFYAESSLILNNIKNYEINLINILIDLDTNYASH